MKARITSLAIGIFVLLLATWAWLVVGGARILVSQDLVRPGDNYVVEEHGNLGAASAPSLVCRYFTGRRTVTRVFWYSENNVFGKDECPFLLRAQQ